MREHDLPIKKRAIEPSLVNLIRAIALTPMTAIQPENRSHLPKRGIVSKALLGHVQLNNGQTVEAEIEDGLVGGDKVIVYTEYDAENDKLKPTKSPYIKYPLFSRKK